MATRLGSHRVALPVVGVVGVLTAVLSGLLIGRGDALIAIIGVAGVLTFLALLFSPQWLMFAGGILIFFSTFSIAGIPLSEAGIALTIAASLVSRRPIWRVNPFLLFLSALLGLWLVFVALLSISDPLVTKRLASLMLWAAAVVVIALPGVARLWIARGLLVGLLLSVPGSLLVGTVYGTRWGGMIGDPNVFAMTIALTVPLISYTMKSRIWKLTPWIVGTGLILLADSRTGLLAITTAVLVFVLAPKLRYWVAGIPVLMLYVASNLPEDVVRGGRWEDRLGSDELRERIAAAAERQIADNFLTGRGLGTGSVDLSVYGDPPQQAVFLLHNSYVAMITEVGMVGMLLFGLLVAGAIVSALRIPVEYGAAASVAAAVAMSTQLGEVFFAVPMALALGFAWHDRSVPDEDLEPPVSADDSVRVQPIAMTN